MTVHPIKLQNLDVLNNLAYRLDHLSSSQRDELLNLVYEFQDLFPNVPNKAVGITHDVDVGQADPIKQYPYGVGPEKKRIIDQEIKYMLENKISEPCVSEWSSPCLLIPKPDGSFHFCTEYRKVNAVTKTDCFQIPRIDALIDDVSGAKYVYKFDLLKGYWQIELTERAKDVDSFVQVAAFFVT